MLRKFLDQGVVSMIDRSARLQKPLVDKYVGFVQSRHPVESPDQIVERLGRHYLIAVTASGVVVGLSAAVPGVGTLVGLAAAGADTVFFIEASTVYTVGASEVAGNKATAPRPPLVSAVVLGQAGTGALGAAGRSAKQWDTMLANKLPVLRRMDDSPIKRFVVQFIVKRGALAFGKVIPAGIGAVVGGVGNHALARGVIKNLHAALDDTARPDQVVPADA
ncbi:hypothetical protein [Nocardia brasiliensis]|uniref:hypothetical protein n=1 Tax=Nocardia brasiliensis TaxID=37326 RepID=UPI0004A77567|nr:hypothetical protein [Nocardia brasiliensis]MBF6126718.1 hypothetical protein [Nocardia brasiliensis]MBF6546891.1 hypothetical protein [Nocardia brasiliensis]